MGTPCALQWPDKAQMLSASDSNITLHASSAGNDAYPGMVVQLMRIGLQARINASVCAMQRS